MTRWWWVRHAPVTAHGGKLYGQTDVPADVDDHPRFEALSTLLPHPAVWITSQLRRTHQTAAAIGDAGYALPEAIVEPDLAEQHFGTWQGVPWSEIEHTRGENVHQFWVAPAEYAPPEGESFAAVVARVASAVARATTEHAGRDIVAVAHGGSIRAALALALGLSPERALSFSVDNLSVTRIEHIVGGRSDEAWRVVAVNQPPR